MVEHQLGSRGRGELIRCRQPFLPFRSCPEHASEAAGSRSNQVAHVLPPVQNMAACSAPVAEQFALPFMRPHRSREPSAGSLHRPRFRTPRYCVSIRSGVGGHGLGVGSLHSYRKTI